MGEWRPARSSVGLGEFELILDSEARRFPPRLPEQPIFYPVLNRRYAEQIARDWNTRDQRSGFAGFVTEFDVLATYLVSFPPKVVGSAQHEELWVPAEQLDEFNANLRSRVRVVKAFYGPKYHGPSPVPLILQTRDPLMQLRTLSVLLPSSGMDFACEVAANWKVVLANFGLWASAPAEHQGLTREDAQRTLKAIRRAWRRPDLPLPDGELVV